jgi:hypothetical protein
MSMGLQTCLLALISACGFWYSSTVEGLVAGSPNGTEYPVAGHTKLEHGVRIVLPNGGSVGLVCETQKPVYDNFGNPERVNKSETQLVIV